MNILKIINTNKLNTDFSHFSNKCNSKSYSLILLLILLATHCSLYAEEATKLTLTSSNIPPAFTAEYSVELGGLTIASLEVQLSQTDPTNWLYHSASTAKGLAAMFMGGEPVTDTSKLQLRENAIKPVFYERIRKTKKADKSEQAIYQWDELLAQTKYKDRQASLTLTDKTTDKFTLQLLIMANINNIPKEFTLPVISKAKLKSYKILNHGEAKITTAYGERDTIFVERIKDDSSYRIWADPHKHGLPLQIERIKEGKTEYIVHLKESSLFSDNEKTSNVTTNPQSSYYPAK